MDSYFLLKLVHILSATVLMGTGTGIAFFLWMTVRTGNVDSTRTVSHLVILADWLFTAPAVLVQIVSGVLLMERLGFSYLSDWFLAVAGLFAFVGCCWLPVVWMQYRLRHLADQSTDALSPGFQAMMRRWTLLGVLAFSAMLVIFWLMVSKPLGVA